jgi:intracellular sulfur oxidation DsrE/DsrF family protein
VHRLSRFLTMVAFSLVCVISASHAESVATKHVSTTKIHRTPKAQTHQAPKTHSLVLQVDQNDPAVMNLALNNATNVIEYYRAKGEEVNVDVVTYGPGLHMLRADTSPVQDRIKNLKDFAFPSKIQFSACNNTREGMEKKEGHPINVLSEATIVPSGVVRLMELQEKGWSYVRP